MTNQQRQQFDQETQERLDKIHQERLQEQNRIQGELARAQQRAFEIQQEIVNQPKRQYAAIVATDLYGGFSKDGQIPWYYPADFKWFQSKTKGHVCVMGRTTYDDIDKRLGEKAAQSVLPDRTCFVVTSRSLERANATPIGSLTELDNALDKMNIPYDKVVFFCGGERIYAESLSKCDKVYMTVINKDIQCDKHFPILGVQKLFALDSVQNAENEPDLRFITWKKQ